VHQAIIGLIAGKATAPRRWEEASMAVFATSHEYVAKQYNKWVYPQPIMDLGAPELRSIRDGGDPETNFYTYWPNQSYRDNLEILIAGCGSNAAARYAFHHPNARVIGIDISPASLAHAAYLKNKHSLDNLTLHNLRLEEVHTLGQNFDFIEASGVLHHLPDPVLGLRALGHVLRPEGTMAIMVYGQYGRTGVYMLQNMFRLLALGQSETDLNIVKETIAILPKHHVVLDYLNRARDTKYDAGLVDTFLHAQDTAYTVAGCLDLVARAGLNFMGWWDNLLYYPEGQLNLKTRLYREVAALPDVLVWQFMELFNGTLGQHCFCVCHRERAERGYKIEFNGNAFMDYVPVRRCEPVLSGTEGGEDCITVQRKPWPQYVLDSPTSALYREIDGLTSIRGCFDRARLPPECRQNRESIARAAFRYLWRLGYIFLRVPV
jgi:SAM-dependent methyltransferase